MFDKTFELLNSNRWDFLEPWKIEENRTKYTTDFSDYKRFYDKVVAFIDQFYLHLYVHLL